MNKQYVLDVATRAFNSLGGLKTKDRDGEFWSFSTSRFAVEIEPFARTSNDLICVGIDASISCVELSGIVNKICGKNGTERCQLEWKQWKRDLPQDADFDAALATLCKEALAYLHSIDFEDLVADLAEKSPQDKSLSQLLHLAALAYVGNMELLQNYRDNMLKGIRSGFVPFISISIIENAITVARQRRAQRGQS